MLLKAYHAYMDESGTHDQLDVIAVAGYLSTHEAWCEWFKEWNPMMRHYAIKDFHMNEFEARRGEFDWRNNWWWPQADETRVRLIERVTNICQRHTIIGLGCAVIRERYEAILTDTIQGDLRHPYYFCLYACLNMLLNYPHPQLEGIKPVQFLFDQKKGRFPFGDTNISWEAHALDFFKRIKSGLDPEGKIIGSMTFGSRREYPQLRAADLLVYEAAKRARQLLKEPDRPIRKSMEVLKKDLNLLITFPSEKQMRNFVKIIETSLEARNRGASEEEMEQIAKQLRQEIER